MPAKMRPLTERMLQKLRDCHDKENASNGAHPCMQDDLKGSLSGLYKRGLVNTKLADINGKKLLCLFVTDEGKNYLKATTQK
jgi:hypothetical protein